MQSRTSANSSIVNEKLTRRTICVRSLNSPQIDALTVIVLSPLTTPHRAGKVLPYWIFVFISLYETVLKSETLLLINIIRQSLRSRLKKPQCMLTLFVTHWSLEGVKVTKKNCFLGSTPSSDQIDEYLEKKTITPNGLDEAYK